MMGSGTNRKWWQEVRGSRTKGRSMTKTRDAKGATARRRIKALRAEAARRSNNKGVA